MASSRPSISIALCTFNGEPFLEEQLASIRSQTILPAEVVICDDGSTDGTIPILERFAAGAPFSVRVERNERRLGSTKNFEKAIELCSGAVIALSDQDDVWEPIKLQRLQVAFESDQAIVMAFSDGEVVDEQGRPMGRRLWQTRAIPVSRGRQKQIENDQLFEILLRYNVVTGATMAFRAGLRARLDPIPSTWVHDAWIALIASLAGRVRAIPEALVRYRQHRRQQIGSGYLSLWEQIRLASSVTAVSFEQVIRNIDNLLARTQPWASTSAIADLTGKRRHFEERLQMRMNPWRRLTAAPMELLFGRYRRFDLGWKSFAQDMLLSRRTGHRATPPPLWGARID